MAIYNAVFRMDQDRPGGPSLGEAGIARRDLWLGRLVHLTPNSPPADPATTYLWEFLDKPTGSAAEFLDERSGLPTATSRLVKFLPDVWGSYRIRLTINKGQYTDTKIAAVILTEDGAAMNRGWRIPAYNEVPSEANFPGQPRGYADDWDFIMADILANGFSGGEGSITLGGDLANWSPPANDKQKVAGLYGYPISSLAGNPASYQTLVVMPRVAEIGPRYQYQNMRLTQDMILPGLSVTSFEYTTTAGTLVEVGSIIGSFEQPVHFTASYSQAAPYDYVTLIDDTNSVEKDVTDTPTDFTSDYTFQKMVYGETVTFTLTVSKNDFVATATKVITWTRKAYWFASAAPEVYNQTFVENSSLGTLTTTMERTFTLTAGSGQYIYYVFREAYGTPVFTVGGFEGGFSLVATIPMTVNGVTENFVIYRSDSMNLGATTVTVTKAPFIPLY